MAGGRAVTLAAGGGGKPSAHSERVDMNNLFIGKEPER
jgi:hypothetical protein